MFHQGCIFCTPTAPQMEATALRQRNIAAAAPPLDFTATVCAAIRLSGCGLDWVRGVQKLLLLLVVAALRLLRS